MKRPALTRAQAEKIARDAPDLGAAYFQRGDVVFAERAQQLLDKDAAQRAAERPPTLDEKIGALIQVHEQLPGDLAKAAEKTIEQHEAAKALEEDNP